MMEAVVTSVGHFKVHARCKKYLVFTDTHGIPALTQDIVHMAASGMPVEWNHVGDKSEKPPDSIKDLISAARVWQSVDQNVEFQDYLENQPIGTHLYIAGDWSTVRLVRRIAEIAGYAAEDIQVRGYGQKYPKVFCASCHSINLAGDDSTLVCQNCGKRIAISDFYSKHHDAVLGYLVLDQTTKKGTS